MDLMVGKIKINIFTRINYLRQQAWGNLIHPLLSMMLSHMRTYTHSTALCYTLFTGISLLMFLPFFPGQYSVYITLC